MEPVRSPSFEPSSRVGLGQPRCAIRGEGGKDMLRSLAMRINDFGRFQVTVSAATSREILLRAPP